MTVAGVDSNGRCIDESDGFPRTVPFSDGKCGGLVAGRTSDCPHGNPGGKFRVVVAQAKARPKLMAEVSVDRDDLAVVLRGFPSATQDAAEFWAARERLRRHVQSDGASSCDAGYAHSDPVWPNSSLSKESK